jgi:hypothetical protein
VVSTFDGIKNTLSGLFGQKDEVPHYKEDLVDLVNREFKRRQDERKAFELQMRLNLAFYEGNQYLEINTAANSLVEQPVLTDYSEREVFNNIAPNIETRISKLKRIRPALTVRPGSTEQDDIHSAKVGTKLLRNVYNDQEIRDKLNDVYIWSETCGGVVFKLAWNPEAGKQVVGLDETGQQVSMPEGDIDVTICPPQEIYPDSCYFQDIEDCKSIIHARAYSIDSIFEQYGVKVREEEATASSIQRSMTGLGGLGYGQGGFHIGSIKLKNHAIVKEYYERPSKEYLEGRLIIVAGGELLHSGPLPFNVGKNDQPGLPFVKLDCLKRPGIFWGKTVLERLIPVQRRYNALRNRKAEYLNRCAIGQWLAEDGATDLDILEQDGTTPGAIIVYQKGFSKPEMVQNPSLPPAFETEEQTLLQEFSILSGVSEISRQSAAPVGVKSGVALSIVQEQDDTRLSNTAENIERAMIRLGKMILRLYRQFVQFPRTLQEIGQNNVVEVIDWVGSDLTSDDVIIESFSAMTESPAIRRQMVFDLLESGLMNNPETGQIDKETRNKVFEMIELGTWESTVDVEQLHVQKAERENRAFTQGQLTQPVQYDDHLLHIDRHNQFRLDAEYEEMVAQNPQVEQIFNAHVQMHQAVINQAMMAQQLAMAQQAQGGDAHAQRV